MTRTRILLATLAVVGAVACASGSGALPAPDPAEIPELEAQVARDANDVDAALRLAAGYRETGRTAEARALVLTSLESSPKDAGLTAMAGLLAEDAGELAAARTHYQALLDRDAQGELREHVEARLRLVRRAELREEVRQALAREGELARTTPDPAAVGVFPFSFEGGDAAWEPLGVALAELLVTDLAVTGRLRVLERIHVQALLDEMALAEAGFVEPATAARSGRLLGAGHVVQGRYRVDDASRVGVDAAVVAVGPPGTERVEPVNAEDAVVRLFELEKRLALDLHAEMGIQLTPAERARVDERHTESVQALLAFGRGLEAADAGNFAQAATHFAEATSLDPSFALARTQRDLAAGSVIATGAVGARQLSAQATRVARQRAAVRALRNAPASVRQRALQRLGQRQRSVLAEVLGQDRVGTTIFLELVFRRPGGTP